MSIFMTILTVFVIVGLFILFNQYAPGPDPAAAAQPPRSGTERIEPVYEKHIRTWGYFLLLRIDEHLYIFTPLGDLEHAASCTHPDHGGRGDE
jgi:hypothetical protein